MSTTEKSPAVSSKTDESPKRGRGRSKKVLETTENGVAAEPAAPASEAKVNGTAAPEEPAKTEEAPKEKPASKPKKGKKGGKKDAKTEVTENGDGDQPPAEKAKPKKKIIPAWATLSDAERAKLKPNQSKSMGISGVQAIVNAIKECANEKGLASYILIKKHIYKSNPNWPKMTFKTALRSAVSKGRVKQIRNSYKVINEAPVEKTKVKQKVSKSRSKTVEVRKECPLEELFPHIFTWVCEPKEASYGLIKKYIVQHFPNLDAETGLKKAIASMVNKGQLDQLTGKGCSGTFQLQDGQKKSGNRYEDPIEDAIIASNLPKDSSIPALKHYLSEYHLEYNVKERPKVLFSAIERAEKKGYIERISGKGMSGSFRLAHNYIPSPKDLWREDYKESDYEPKRKAAKTHDDSSDDDDEESDGDDNTSASDDDSEDEVVPTKKKRGAPTPRKGAAPKAKKAPASKAKKTPAKAKPAAKKSQPAAKKGKATPKKKGKGKKK